MGFLKAAAKAAIPTRYHARIRSGLRRLKFFGLRRHCVCCSAHLSSFQPFGSPQRAEARCPVCRSLERHRLIYLYVCAKTDLFDGHHKKMLHVAPEPQLSRLFRRAPGVEYVSADLQAPNAMVKMDIRDIPYPDNTFDVIYCSHVLEHVPEDRRAMREFYRVLKPGGWAILQVPITGAATLEDPTATSPEQRETVFGQRDHVRTYGADYGDRLRDAGFCVAADGFARELGDRKIRRYGLPKTMDVYFCTKRAE